MYGISRVTGHAVLQRWREADAAGLEERSRALLRHPNQGSVLPSNAGNSAQFQCG